MIFFILFLPFILCADYHVGDDQTYSSIGAALDVIQEGDTVYVHYRASAYKEKFVIGYDNVKISGVCSSGNCPILEGIDAVTPSTQEFTNEDRGIIKIGTSNHPGSECPDGVVIENLHIRSARPAYSYNGNYPSGTADYSNNAGCVYVECAKNLIIRHNEIEDCGNGIFSGLFYGETENVVIEHNYVHGNGIEDSYYEHNLYTSAVGITYQYNHFGPLRSGCLGNNLKDRGVGSIVRYNWIEDGSRQIDLVEQYSEDRDDVRSLPEYNLAWVYGNILFENTESGNRQIIHFGGDSGEEDTYRKGPLYVYYNTIISKRTDARSTVLRLSSNDAVAYYSNNIIYSDGTNQWELLSSLRGNLYLNDNAIKDGYINAVEEDYDGVISDENTISITPEDVDSGDVFQDFDLNDFGLASGSPCLGRAGMVESEVCGDFLPDCQYVDVDTCEDRMNLKDLGAFAYDPDDDDFEPSSIGCIAGFFGDDLVGDRISGSATGGAAFGYTFLALFCFSMVTSVIFCCVCVVIVCFFVLFLLLAVTGGAGGVGGGYYYYTTTQKAKENDVDISQKKAPVPPPRE